jgi:hypothetical protein
MCTSWIWKRFKKCIPWKDTVKVVCASVFNLSLCASMTDWSNKVTVMGAFSSVCVCACVSAVTCMTQDVNFLFTGSDDMRILVWDLYSCISIATLEGTHIWHIGSKCPVSHGSPLVIVSPMFTDFMETCRCVRRSHNSCARPLVTARWPIGVSCLGCHFGVGLCHI